MGMILEITGGLLLAAQVPHCFIAGVFLVAVGGDFIGTAIEEEHSRKIQNELQNKITQLEQQIYESPN